MTFFVDNFPEDFPSHCGFRVKAKLFSSASHFFSSSPSSFFFFLHYILNFYGLILE